LFDVNSDWTCASDKVYCNRNSV